MPLLAAGGVDALDPELAELALAGPAVAERVLQRVHDLLVGGAVRTALVAVVALGPLEGGAAVLLAVDGALDPGHRELLSEVGGAVDGRRSAGSDAEQALDAGAVAAGDLDVAGRGGACASDDFFSRMWLRKALRRMSLPVPVILKRLAAPRWVFILGIVVCSSSLVGSGRSRPSVRPAASACAPSRRRCRPRSVASRACFGCAWRCAAWAFLSGASTMVMLRPSSFGDDLDPGRRATTSLGDLVEDPLARARGAASPGPGT